MKDSTLTLLTCVFLASLFSAKGISPTEERVCSQSRTTYQSYQTSTQYYYTQSYRCCIFNWCRCYRRLSSYRNVMRNRPLTVYFSVCCDGYSGTLGNCQPICSDCPDTHLCLAPSMCACPADMAVNTCTEPPQNVTLEAIAYDGLRITWDPPQNSTNENFYIVYFQGKRYRIESTESLTLDLTDSLTPYTTYNCCVAVSTTSGPSQLSCTSQTTLESVPRDEPQNVSVSTVSPTEIQVQWEPPDVPNGIIIIYSIYINGTLTVNVTAETGGIQSHSVDGFSPNQQLRVSLSASTGVGEGPQTPQHTVMTHESVPGAVSDVDVYPEDDNTLSITWQPPLLPNGVLTNYHITLTNLISSDMANYTVANYTTTPTQHHYNISSGIEPFTRYKVTVTASTMIGPGDPFSLTLYSREGAPETSPLNTATTRTSPTRATIEWKEISIKELRGWFVSYEIRYESIDSEFECATSDNTTYNETVSMDEEMYELIGLDPGLQYCVWVAGRTTAGVGPFSHFFIPWYENSEFLLEMERPKCAEWVLEKGEDDVVKDLKREMGRGMEQFCQCTFPISYIANGTLTCNDNKLLFKGRIISLGERSSAQLVEDLQKWVANRPTIITRGERLQVVPPLVSKPDEETKPNVTDTDKPLPETKADGVQEDQSLQSSSFPIGPVIGAIAAVVSIAVIAVIMIIIALLCHQKRSKTTINITDISHRPRQNSSYDAMPSMGKQPQDYEKTGKELEYELPEIEIENVYEDPEILMNNPDFCGEQGLCNPSYVDMTAGNGEDGDGAYGSEDSENYSTIKQSEDSM